MVRRGVWRVCRCCDSVGMAGIDVTVAPGRGSVWRPMTARERRELGPRCSATGLLLGDCDQQRFGESPYCYYHEKIACGHIDTFVAKNASLAWEEVSPRSVYPVYPLPVVGYVLLVATPQAVAA